MLPVLNEEYRQFFTADDYAGGWGIAKTLHLLQNKTAAA
jgi:hypothetical protein